MREHFLQNKHFTNILPKCHCQLSSSPDRPPQEAQLRNLLAVWDSELGFATCKLGFPLWFSVSHL